MHLYRPTNRDIEQWRKENDEQHLQKVLEEGMFSFKRKAPETAEIHIIEEGLSTVGCPTPVRLYANTGSKKKLSKSPVHSLRFNWMRDNPNGLRRIEEFCMDNAFSRDMPGKERCFHGGVDANLWRDTEEDMLRVYLKIDNICKNARNKELITDVE